jgi:transcriptional regulator
MMRAVVGIELGIERLVGKLKLSQNRAADDRAGVVEGLDAQTSSAEARAMAHRLRDLAR